MLQRVRNQAAIWRLFFRLNSTLLPGHYCCAAGPSTSTKVNTTVLEWITLMRHLDHYFARPRHDALYHYTGISSLLGIAKGKCVWAGSVRYMNDSEELLHAFDRLEEVLNQRVSTSPPLNPRYDFERQMLRWVEEMRDATDLHLFTFSLSEVPSLLSQWRSYTPHGKGVSIGFGQQLLTRVTADGRFKLGKCLYEEEAQNGLLETLLDHLWMKCEATPSLQQKNHLAPAWRYYGIFKENQSDIYRALALIKHRSFAEECEWRLISQLFHGLEDCSFREGGTMLVPYKEIQLNDVVTEPLFLSLTIGPTPHTDLSLAALR